MFTIKFSIYTDCIIWPTIHIQNSLEVINLDCTLKCDMTPRCTLTIFLALGTTHYFPLVQMTGRAHLRQNETISNWWA